MSDAVSWTDTVRIPPSALTVHAVRASGPGGQNVNKVATKIELRVDLAAVEGLCDAARAGPPPPPPRRRVKTAPPARAGQRRLTGKKRRGAVKRWRARPGESD